MTIEQTIVTVMTSDGTLAALVPSRYAGRLPQNPSYPNICFFRVATSYNVALDSVDALTNARFQFDIRDTTLAGAKASANALRNALTASATLKAIPVTEHDWPYEPDALCYRIVADYSIFYAHV